MSQRGWFQSRAVIWICIVLFPPLGLVLPWVRRGSWFFTRMLGSLAALGFGVLHLFLFWGLRMEMDGGMRRPIFTFRSPEQHDAEIEKRRAAERSVDASRLEAIVPPTDPTPGVSPEAGAASEPKPAVSVAYWTEFRGPGHRGIYDETAVLTEWPAGGLYQLWKRPVGGGYASMVIADGTIFTIEQRRQKEVVAAYGLETGKEKWIHGWDAEFRETLGGDGPRTTPVWHEGRLYALGATGEFRCLDAASGKRIWSRNILTENGAGNLTWGMAASPLIVEDKVIVLPGGKAGKSVCAYHRLTGEPIWRALDDTQAYVSPQLATLAGRRQILVVTANRVVGVTVEDGSLLWEFPWPTQNGINITQPIVTGDDRFFISSGYDHGAALVELIPNAGKLEARAIWQNKRMKNKFATSVLFEGMIYGFDEAILACLDPSNGDLKWKGGRYGYGQVLLASGYLIILSENGEVVLVKATPEGHQEVARFPALEGKTWNVPAIAEGHLLVRNSSEMACFRLGK
jgi:outer membrane protein assembly factor BamB